jgi:AraC-like DNA-binding protein
MRDSPRTRPRSTFREIAAKANGNVGHYGGGGAPTTVVCGSLSFERASLKPITQLLPRFILIKADQAHTLTLHNTMQALASEMAEQAPGSEVVATRLAEVLFIQALRAHIASQVEWRNKGWLRAIFDPQVGAALGAVHDSVSTPWTVESLAAAATMSRSAFAVRFKELLGQTPLEYVTEWRMQKAMQLLQQRDKKLIDVARLVGYDSDAAFSKAFKRVAEYEPCQFLALCDNVLAVHGDGRKFFECDHQPDLELWIQPNRDARLFRITQRGYLCVQPRLRARRNSDVVANDFDR